MKAARRVPNLGADFSNRLQRTITTKPEPPNKQPAPTLPFLCTVTLEGHVVDKLATRLKNDGRAHALFDLWRNLVNQSSALSFTLRPAPGAKATLHTCLECGAPFSTGDLVFRHYRHAHTDKALKRVEKTIEPPKGNFQFIAKCGLCKTPLCPPNYHEFTERLLAHHRERHDRVPLEEFRAKVANTSNPDEMEAWKKAASIVEEWHCAQCDQLVPGERELLEHLKSQHGERLEKPEPEITLPAGKVHNLDCRDLRRLCNQVWDKEKKEPGHFLSLLRQGLNQRGLQIFRDILGHQYACRYRPRHVSPRDQITPRQQEMLSLASAPARRGHKPNRHTLRDHFAAQGATEQEVYADVDALVRMGLMVEFDNGQLDALGPGSHIESK
ncbi:MAG: hypothetical protein FJ388_15485 [Verrucomicrobia bacterium]|nr:hypothetical protein [Verrucomicrobiota bacterium]